MWKENSQLENIIRTHAQWGSFEINNRDTDTQVEAYSPDQTMFTFFL